MSEPREVPPSNQNLADDIQSFASNTPNNDDLAAAIAGLADNSGAQVDAIRGLRESIHEEALARDRKVRALQRIIVVVLAALVLLVAVVVTNLYTLKTQNDAAKARSEAATAQRTQQQADTEKVLKAIQGCTEPGGACFRANRDDTATALSYLSGYELVTGFCDKTTDSGTAYLACVKEHAPPGTPTSLPK